MGQLVPSSSLHTRALWIVLAAGVVAGAVTAKGRATPPAVSLSSAGGSPTTAVAANTADTSTPSAAASADTFGPPHIGESLVLREEAPLTREPATDVVGSAIPIPSVGWPALLLLGFLVGGGAFVAAARGRLSGSRSPMESLEVLDSLRVSGRWQVSLVRAPGRLLVIGASNQEVTLLAELDPEPGDAAPILDRSEPSLEEPGPARAQATTVDDQEDDPILGDLMSQLNESPSTVYQAAGPLDERLALRRRLQALHQHGPTQF